MTNEIDSGKRKFIKKASYIAPVVLTMTAIPSFANTGSGWSNGNGNGNGGQSPQHRNPARR